MIVFCGTCILCGLSTRNASDFCDQCKAQLPWSTNVCYRCGEALSSDATTYCGKCIKKKPTFNRTISLFHYQNPINRFIPALKFANKLIYSKILGELFAAKLISCYDENNPLPEVIIPVPLHRKRLCERGYNQALEIARPISKKLNIPIDFRSCRRVKYTKPQTLITLNERHKNVLKAFEININFHAKHVAIIDDVVTTASTVEEIAKILRRRGVQTIDVWCCARVNANENK